MIAAGKIVQFNIECFVMAQLWILFEAKLISDWNFPTFLDVTWKANAFNSHLHHEMCKSNISSTRQTLMNIDNMGMSPAVFPVHWVNIAMLLLIPFVESITTTKPRFLLIILHIIISTYRTGGSNSELNKDNIIFGKNYICNSLAIFGVPVSVL